MNDLKFAVRQLLKNPGFTFVAVLTLALGIAANTVMFSVVNAVLLRPLPFPESERLMFVEAQGVGNFAAPDFRDLATPNHSFVQVGAVTDTTFNFSGGSQPERVNSARISSGFLSALGVQPLLGRNLSVEEDREGSENVVLLAYGLWQRQFGGDPGIVGRAVRL